jgi:hypothetical protein
MSYVHLLIITILIEKCNDKFEFLELHVKVLLAEDTCPSTTMVDGKMTSKSWISDRVGDWL